MSRTAHALAAVGERGESSLFKGGTVPNGGPLGKGGRERGDSSEWRSVKLHCLSSIGLGLFLGLGNAGVRALPLVAHFCLAFPRSHWRQSRSAWLGILKAVSRSVQRPATGKTIKSPESYGQS